MDPIAARPTRPAALFRLALKDFLLELSMTNFKVIQTRTIHTAQ